MAKVKLEKLVNVQEDQFPSNSKASRDEEANKIVAEIKPKQPVKAMRRRKSITRSIKETFFSEDSKNVADYVIYEILVPAAKSMFSDAFTQAIEMLIFGEGGSSRRSPRNRSEKTFVQYGDMYRRRDEPREPVRASRRDRFELDNIYFRNGEQATDVLASLCDLLEEYDQVSVQDYYDLAGLDGTTHIHAKWGWTNLKDAYCTYTRSGHRIVMPRPIELD